MLPSLPVLRVLLLLTLVFVATCVPGTARDCAADADCDDDHICVRGACVEGHIAEGEPAEGEGDAGEGEGEGDVGEGEGEGDVGEGEGEGDVGEGEGEGDVGEGEGEGDVGEGEGDVGEGEGDVGEGEGEGEGDNGGGPFGGHDSVQCECNDGHAVDRCRRLEQCAEEPVRRFCQRRCQEHDGVASRSCEADADACQ
jgi:hypothetical protein